MKAIVGAILLTAAALGVTAWCVAGDRALEILTPRPERVVQNLVGTLAGKRPESAATQMAGDAADAAGRLRALDRTLRERHGDYRFADAQAVRRGDEADVRAELRSSRGERFAQRFALVRDSATRLWKVTAFTDE